MHLKSGPVFFIHVLYVLSYVLSNFLGNLVTFTEEILNGKFHFCAVSLPKNKSKSKYKYKIFLTKYRLEPCNFVTKEMAKYLSENFQKKKKTTTILQSPCGETSVAESHVSKITGVDSRHATILKRNSKQGGFPVYIKVFHVQKI